MLNDTISINSLINPEPEPESEPEPLLQEPLLFTYPDAIVHDTNENTQTQVIPLLNLESNNQSNNTQFNRHFSYSLFTGSNITDAQRSNVQESYFIVDGSDVEEIPYIKGMQAAFNSGQINQK